MTEMLPRRIENAATGDRMIVLQSPLLGEGDVLVFRSILPAGGAGAPLHVHDAMTETFTIEQGALEILLGKGEVLRLEAGETITIQPGTPHGFRNALDSETRFVVTADPGAELERFLRHVYQMGNEQAAGERLTIARALAFGGMMAGTDMVLGGMPRWLQRGLWSLAARLAGSNARHASVPVAPPIAGLAR